MFKVCLLGFGGMGRSHFGAYEKIEAAGDDIKVVAICDINPEMFNKVVKTNIDDGQPSRLEGRHLYTDFDEMMKNEECDMVDVVLPTYLHKEYTIRAFAYGKNVMCEKPMALTEEDCREMIEASEKYGRKLMIGQCLRFDPAYLFLKDAVDNGKFGKCKAMFFDRFSGIPRWSYGNWFQDDKKSGGCALDMHIHDVDMVRFLLGEPKAVTAVASPDISKWQLMNSRFTYDEVPVVVATGSWSEPRTLKFRMSYRVLFEKAEIIFEGGKVMVYPDEGEAYQAELHGCDRLCGEMRFFINEIILGGKQNLTNPPESAMMTVALVDKLRQSADLGGVVVTL